MLSRIQSTNTQQNMETHKKRVSHTGIEEQIRAVDPNRPHVDVYEIRREVDQFPDPSLSVSMDQNEQLQPKSAVQKMLQAARESEFHESYSEQLQQIIFNNLSLFQIKFSPVAAKITVLRCFVY